MSSFDFDAALKEARELRKAAETAGYDKHADCSGYMTAADVLRDKRAAYRRYEAERLRQRRETYAWLAGCIVICGLLLAIGQTLDIGDWLAYIGR